MKSSNIRINTDHINKKKANLYKNKRQMVDIITSNYTEITFAIMGNYYLPALS